MRKGLILITFAWTVEVFGVLTGFVTAMTTVFGFELPEQKWKLLIALPMAMVAVAELGRIPMTSVLFRRNTRMQIVAVVGIVFLAGIACMNWFFGFERIAELRLEQATAIDLKIKTLTSNLGSLESQRKDAEELERKAREEFRKEREANEEAITNENEGHQKNIDLKRQSCRMTPQHDQCMITELKKENARHDEAMAPLLEMRKEINEKITKIVKTNPKDIDDKIAKLNLDISAANEERNAILSQNQIYRIAAMVFGTKDTSEVSGEQFQTVRKWFCIFSAVAVSLTGTTAALVYYAADRTPTKYGPVGKTIAGIRAWFARKRRKLYVIKYRDGVQYVDKPVPVRQPHLVLVPWFIKYPMQIALKKGRVQMLKVMEEELKDEVDTVNKDKE